MLDLGPLGSRRALLLATEIIEAYGPTYNVLKMYSEVHKSDVQGGVASIWISSRTARHQPASIRQLPAVSCRPAMLSYRRGA